MATEKQRARGLLRSQTEMERPRAFQADRGAAAGAATPEHQEVASDATQEVIER